MNDTLGHVLIQVCRAHRNKAAELLTPLDLHPGQEFLLYNLWNEDGVAQSELAERLGVQAATLTRMIDRMEKGGLVERRVDASDQRVSRVYLTPQGGALEPAVCAMWDDLERATCAMLTVEERVLLRRLLLQVRDNLH